VVGLGSYSLSLSTMPMTSIEEEEHGGSQGVIQYLHYSIRNVMHSVLVVVVGTVRKTTPQRVDDRPIGVVGRDAYVSLARSKMCGRVSDDDDSSKKHSDSLDTHCLYSVCQCQCDAWRRAGALRTRYFFS
jgi:hypothetical protein